MLTVPLIISVVFGYVFKNGQINEAPIAIVDMDNSAYSLQLINKLNASQYIDVSGIYHNSIDPNKLLYNEKYVGVLYLPEGLETSRLQGKQTNVGFYVDMALPAATGNVRSGVTEVLSAENSAYALGRIKATGLSDSQASGTISNMAIQQRLLYNPTNDTMSSSVIGFVNTIMLSLLSGAVLTIVPRLREEERLKNALDNPIGIISRVLPYAVIACAALYLSTGLLKHFGGLRFEGNVAQVSIPFLLFTISASLFAMLLGWTAPTSAKAGGRGMLVILPAFLLGGVQSPVMMLPDPLQRISNLLPITWHFKFIRGVGLRGGDLRYFIPELGGISLLIVGLLIGIFLLILKEKKKLESFAAEEELDLMPDLMKESAAR
ncbi:ABC transporter permease [Bacillus sp. V5-8f]|nr:ABC transporter permease [Bacillus sp. V5-8f]